MQTVSSQNGGDRSATAIFKEHGQVIAVILSILIAAILLSRQISGVEERLVDRIGRLEVQVQRLEDELADARERLSYVLGLMGADSEP